MICPKCNNTIPDGGAFCPKCGFRLAEAEAPETIEAAAPETIEAAAPEKKKLSAKMIGILAGAVALICIVLVVVLLAMRANKVKQYDAAVALLEDQSYEEAQKALAKLGGYKDAKILAAYAAGHVQLDEGDFAQAQETFSQLGDYEDASKLASYASGRLLLKQETYDKAMDIFSKLGSFRDSADLAAQCQNELTYADAVAKRTAGDYAAAIALFETIPGVKDVDKQLTDCKALLANEKIAAAIAKKDWDAALELLDSEEGKTYPDYDKVRQNCWNHANYEKAKQAMDDKRYYTAYKLFSAMGNYENAASLANSCIRPAPDSGEMYRNAKYKGSAVRLNLANKLPGSYDIYVRIYDVSGEIWVSQVYIRPTKVVSLYLPEDTYCIKVAFGRSAWYGEYEMFGDEGIYRELATQFLHKARSRYGGWFYYDFEDLMDGTAISLEEF